MLALIFAAPVFLHGALPVFAGFTFTPVTNTGTASFSIASLSQPSTFPVSNPFGDPVITQTSGGWRLDFLPSAAYYASADNFGGSLSVASSLQARLAFDVTFDEPVHLDLIVLESGIFSRAGGAGVGHGGMATLTPLAPGPVEPPRESADFGTGTVLAALEGTWRSSTNISDTQGFSTRYRVTIDDLLVSEAAAGSLPAASTFSTLDFSILLNPTSGGVVAVPEPASIGLLLGGCLLLMQRRSSRRKGLAAAGEAG
jgi:hypothetical protein